MSGENADAYRGIPAGKGRASVKATWVSAAVQRHVDPPRRYVFYVSCLG